MGVKKSGFGVKSWLTLLAGLALLLWLQRHPAWVERWYAQGIFPWIAAAQRFVLGWIPFSVGDVLIAVVTIIALAGLGKGLSLLWRKKATWAGTGRKTLGVLRWLLLLYLLFHAAWGLNYYRQGTAALLQLQPEPYQTAEVTRLCHTLMAKLEQLAADSAVIRALQTQNREQLTEEAMGRYTVLRDSLKLRFIRPASFKPHLLGPLQSYTGYGGYYFPFTGEAHANLREPAFVLPFTVAHEIAHQQGFGSESEANMVAYLVTRGSTNPFTRYSTYASLYSYAIGEYAQRDSSAARALHRRLPAMLQEDRRALQAFYDAHRNPLQPLLNAVYTRYLMSNNQPEGLESYNRVVAWLVAYARRYGWDKL